MLMLGSKRALILAITEHLKNSTIAQLVGVPSPASTLNTQYLIETEDFSA